MNNFMLSIITVCYNSAKTIEQTIQSVINQNYDNIEYIIIDGGSTDGTLDIIKKYEDKISYWVSESDEGLYDAMNKGIKVATGNIVGIINSDDWYNQGVLEKVAETFRDEHAEVVYGDVINISNTGACLHKSNKHIVKDDLFVRIIYDHPTIFVRKSVYEKYGGFDCRYRISADYHLLLKFYSNNVIFKYLPVDVAYFRLNGGIGHTKNRCAYMDDRNIALEFLDKSPDKPTYFSRIMQRYNLKRKLALNNFYYRRMCKFLEPESRKKIVQQFLEFDKKYVIFGAGEDGVECYQWLHDNEVPIKYFLDNSPVRQSETIKGLLIKSPDILKKDKNAIKVLIAMSNYKTEIKKQLNGLGLNENENYEDFKEIQDKIIKQYIRKRMPWVYKAPKHIWE